MTTRSMNSLTFFFVFSGGVATAGLAVSEKSPPSSSKSSNRPPPDAERGFCWEEEGGKSGEKVGEERKRDK